MKVKSKYSKDINLSTGTINFLEEKTGVNLYSLGLGNRFETGLPKQKQQKKTRQTRYYNNK